MDPLTALILAKASAAVEISKQEPTSSLEIPTAVPSLVPVGIVRAEIKVTSQIPFECLDRDGECYNYTSTIMPGRAHQFQRKRQIVTSNTGVWTGKSSGNRVKKVRLLGGPITGSYKQEEFSKQDLDDELDRYMSTTREEVQDLDRDLDLDFSISKEELDMDLDDYMKLRAESRLKTPNTVSEVETIDPVQAEEIEKDEGDVQKIEQ